MFFAFVACNGSSSTPVTANQSYIQVSPDEFTQDVECRWSAGPDEPLSYYVATLLDVTSGASLSLPSSPPTRCATNSVFLIAPDQFGDAHVPAFAAVIDGYPNIDGLAALRSTARELSVDGVAVRPSWQWVCGVGGLSAERLEAVLTVARSLQRQSTTTPSTDAGSATTDPPSLGTDAGSEAGGGQPPLLDAGVFEGVSSDAEATSTAALMSTATPTPDASSSAPPGDAGRSDASLSSSGTVQTEAGGASSSTPSDAGTSASSMPSDAGTSASSMPSDAGPNDAASGIQALDATLLSLVRDADVEPESPSSPFESPELPGPSVARLGTTVTVRGCVQL